MSRGVGVIGVLLLAGASVWSASATIPVGDFSGQGLAQWEEKSFVGNTRYALMDSEHGRVVAAQADGSASGLFREIRVDLEKTPYLNWSWLVRNTLQGNDERSRAGDDYPARIYVVISGGVFFWKTRAINYVWSSHQPAGSQWPNAYTENARMIALRSGDRHVGQWFAEKRNVREDLRQVFGKDFSHIDAVALMVDTDDTQQRASAMFGDIWFSAN